MENLILEIDILRNEKPAENRLFIFGKVRRVKPYGQPETKTLAIAVSFISRVMVAR